MKWKNPRVGEVRIKSGFLLFPKTLENITRWLEFATWEEMYDGWSSKDWGAIRWLDIKKEKSFPMQNYNQQPKDRIPAPPPPAPRRRNKKGRRCERDQV